MIRPSHLEYSSNLMAISALIGFWGGLLVGKPLGILGAIGFVLGSVWLILSIWKYPYLCIIQSKDYDHGYGNE